MTKDLLIPQGISLPLTIGDETRLSGTYLVSAILDDNPISLPGSRYYWEGNNVVYENLEHQYKLAIPPEYHYLRIVIDTDGTRSLRFCNQEGKILTTHNFEETTEENTLTNATTPLVTNATALVGHKEALSNIELIFSKQDGLPHTSTQEYTRPLFLLKGGTHNSSNEVHVLPLETTEGNPDGKSPLAPVGILNPECAIFKPDIAGNELTLLYHSSSLQEPLLKTIPLVRKEILAELKKHLTSNPTYLIVQENSVHLSDSTEDAEVMTDLKQATELLQQVGLLPQDKDMENPDTITGKYFFPLIPSNVKVLPPQGNNTARWDAAAVLVGKGTLSLNSSPENSEFILFRNLVLTHVSVDKGNPLTSLITNVLPKDKSAVKHILGNLAAKHVQIHLSGDDEIHSSIQVDQNSISDAANPIATLIHNPQFTSTKVAEILNLAGISNSAHYLKEVQKPGAPKDSGDVSKDKDTPGASTGTNSGVAAAALKEEEGSDSGQNPKPDAAVVTEVVLPRSALAGPQAPGSVTKLPKDSGDVSKDKDTSGAATGTNSGVDGAALKEEEGSDDSGQNPKPGAAVVTEVVLPRSGLAGPQAPGSVKPGAPLLDLGDDSKDKDTHGASTGTNSGVDGAALKEEEGSDSGQNPKPDAAVVTEVVLPRSGLAGPQAPGSVHKKLDELQDSVENPKPSAAVVTEVVLPRSGLAGPQAPGSVHDELQESPENPEPGAAVVTEVVLPRSGLAGPQAPGSGTKSPKDSGDVSKDKDTPGASTGTNSGVDGAALKEEEGSDSAQNPKPGAAVVTEVVLPRSALAGPQAPGSVHDELQDSVENPGKGAAVVTEVVLPGSGLAGPQAPGSVHDELQESPENPGKGAAAVTEVVLPGSALAGPQAPSSGTKLPKDSGDVSKDKDAPGAPTGTNSGVDGAALKEEEGSDSGQNPKPGAAAVTEVVLPRSALAGPQAPGSVHDELQESPENPGKGAAVVTEVVLPRSALAGPQAPGSVTKLPKDSGDVSKDKDAPGAPTGTNSGVDGAALKEEEGSDSGQNPKPDAAVVTEVVLPGSALAGPQAPGSGTKSPKDSGDVSKDKDTPGAPTGTNSGVAGAALKEEEGSDSGQNPKSGAAVVTEVVLPRSGLAGPQAPGSGTKSPKDLGDVSKDKDTPREPTGTNSGVAGAALKEEEGSDSGQNPKPDAAVVTEVVLPGSALAGPQAPGSGTKSPKDSGDVSKDKDTPGAPTGTNSGVAGAALKEEEGSDSGQNPKPGAAVVTEVVLPGSALAGPQAPGSGTKSPKDSGDVSKDKDTPGASTGTNSGVDGAALKEEEGSDSGQNPKPGAAVVTEVVLPRSALAGPQAPGSVTKLPKDLGDVSKDKDTPGASTGTNSGVAGAALKAEEGSDSAQNPKPGAAVVTEVVLPGSGLAGPQAPGSGTKSPKDSGDVSKDKDTSGASTGTNSGVAGAALKEEEGSDDSGQNPKPDAAVVTEVVLPRSALAGPQAPGSGTKLPKDSGDVSKDKDTPGAATGTNSGVAGAALLKEEEGGDSGQNPKPGAAVVTEVVLPRSALAGPQAPGSVHDELQDSVENPGKGAAVVTEVVLPRSALAGPQAPGSGTKLPKDSGDVSKDKDTPGAPTGTNSGVAAAALKEEEGSDSGQNPKPDAAVVTEVVLPRSALAGPQAPGSVKPGAPLLDLGDDSKDKDTPEAPTGTNSGVSGAALKEEEGSDSAQNPKPGAAVVTEVVLPRSALAGPQAPGSVHDELQESPENPGKGAAVVTEVVLPRSALAGPQAPGSVTKLPKDSGDVSKDKDIPGAPTGTNSGVAGAALGAALKEEEGSDSGQNPKPDTAVVTEVVLPRSALAGPQAPGSVHDELQESPENPKPGAAVVTEVVLPRSGLAGPQAPGSVHDELQDSVENPEPGAAVVTEVVLPRSALAGPQAPGSGTKLPKDSGDVSKDKDTPGAATGTNSGVDGAALKEEEGSDSGQNPKPGAVVVTEVVLPRSGLAGPQAPGSGTKSPKDSGDVSKDKDTPGASTGTNSGVAAAALKEEEGSDDSGQNPKPGAAVVTEVVLPRSGLAGPQAPGSVTKLPKDSGDVSKDKDTPGAPTGTNSGVDGAALKEEEGSDSGQNPKPDAAVATEMVLPRSGLAGPQAPGSGTKLPKDSGDVSKDKDTPGAATGTNSGVDGAALKEEEGSDSGQNPKPDAAVVTEVVLPRSGLARPQAPGSVHDELQESLENPGKGAAVITEVVLPRSALAGPQAPGSGTKLPKDSGDVSKDKDTPGAATGTNSGVDGAALKEEEGSDSGQNPKPGAAVVTEVVLPRSGLAGPQAPGSGTKSPKDLGDVSKDKDTPGAPTGTNSGVDGAALKEEEGSDSGQNPKPDTAVVTEVVLPRSALAGPQAPGSGTKSPKDSGDVSKDKDTPGAPTGTNSGVAGAALKEEEGSDSGQNPKPGAAAVTEVVLPRSALAGPQAPGSGTKLPKDSGDVSKDKDTPGAPTGTNSGVDGAALKEEEGSDSGQNPKPDAAVATEMVLPRSGLAGPQAPGSVHDELQESPENPGKGAAVVTEVVLPRSALAGPQAPGSVHDELQDSVENPGKGAAVVTEVVLPRSALAGPQAPGSGTKLPLDSGDVSKDKDTPGAPTGTNSGVAAAALKEEEGSDSGQNPKPDAAVVTEVVLPRSALAGPQAPGSGTKLPKDSGDVSKDKDTPEAPTGTNSGVSGAALKEEEGSDSGQNPKPDAAVVTEVVLPRSALAGPQAPGSVTKLPKDLGDVSKDKDTPGASTGTNSGVAGAALKEEEGSDSAQNPKPGAAVVTEVVLPGSALAGPQAPGSGTKSPKDSGDVSKDKDTSGASTGINSGVAGAALKEEEGSDSGQNPKPDTAVVTEVVLPRSALAGPQAPGSVHDELQESPENPKPGAAVVTEVVLPRSGLAGPQAPGSVHDELQDSVENPGKGAAVVTEVVLPRSGLAGPQAPGSGTKLPKDSGDVSKDKDTPGAPTGTNSGVAGAALKEEEGSDSGQNPKSGAAVVTEVVLPRSGLAGPQAPGSGTKSPKDSGDVSKDKNTPGASTGTNSGVAGAALLKEEEGGDSGQNPKPGAAVVTEVVLPRSGLAGPQAPGSVHDELQESPENPGKGAAVVTEVVLPRSALAGPQAPGSVHDELQDSVENPGKGAAVVTEVVLPRSALAGPQAPGSGTKLPLDSGDVSKDKDTPGAPTGTNSGVDGAALKEEEGSDSGQNPKPDAAVVTEVVLPRSGLAGPQAPGSGTKLPLDSGDVSKDKDTPGAPTGTNSGVAAAALKAEEGSDDSGQNPKPGAVVVTEVVLPGSGLPGPQAPGSGTKSPKDSGDVSKDKDTPGASTGTNSGVAAAALKEEEGSDSGQNPKPDAAVVTEVVLPRSALAGPQAPGSVHDELQESPENPGKGAAVVTEVVLPGSGLAGPQAPGSGTKLPKDSGDVSKDKDTPGAPTGTNSGVAGAALKEEEGSDSGQNPKSGAAVVTEVVLPRSGLAGPQAPGSGTKSPKDSGDVSKDKNTPGASTGTNSGVAGAALLKEEEGGDSGQNPKPGAAVVTEVVLPRSGLAGPQAPGSGTKLPKDSGDVSKDKDTPGAATGTNSGVDGAALKEEEGSDSGQNPKPDAAAVTEVVLPRSALAGPQAPGSGTKLPKDSGDVSKDKDTPGAPTGTNSGVDGAALKEEEGSDSGQNPKPDAAVATEMVLPRSGLAGPQAPGSVHKKLDELQDSVENPGKGAAVVTEVVLPRSALAGPQAPGSGTKSPKDSGDVSKDKDTPGASTGTNSGVDGAALKEEEGSDSGQNPKPDAAVATEMVLPRSGLPGPQAPGSVHKKLDELQDSVENPKPGAAVVTEVVLPRSALAGPQAPGSGTKSPKDSGDVSKDKDTPGASTGTNSGVDGAALKEEEGSDSGQNPKPDAAVATEMVLPRSGLAGPQAPGSGTKLPKDSGDVSKDKDTPGAPTGTNSGVDGAALKEEEGSDSGQNPKPDAAVVTEVVLPRSGLAGPQAPGSVHDELQESPENPGKGAAVVTDGAAPGIVLEEYGVEDLQQDGHVLPTLVIQNLQTSGLHALLSSRALYAEPMERVAPTEQTVIVSLQLGERISTGEGLERYHVSVQLPTQHGTPSFHAADLPTSGYFFQNREIAYLNRGKNYGLVIPEQYHFLKIVKSITSEGSEEYHLRFCDKTGIVLQHTDFGASPSAKPYIWYGHYNFKYDVNALNDVEHALISPEKIGKLNLKEAYEKYGEQPYFCALTKESTEDPLPSVMMSFSDDFFTFPHPILLNKQYALLEYDQQLQMCTLRVGPRNAGDMLFPIAHPDYPMYDGILRTARKAFLDANPLYLLTEGQEFKLHWGKDTEGYTLLEKREQVEEVIEAISGGGHPPSSPQKYALRLTLNGATPAYYHVLDNGKGASIQEFTIQTNTGVVHLPISQKDKTGLALSDDDLFKIIRFTSSGDVEEMLPENALHNMGQKILAGLIPDTLGFIVEPGEAGRVPSGGIQILGLKVPYLAEFGLLAPFIGHNSPEVVGQNSKEFLLKFLPKLHEEHSTPFKKIRNIDEETNMHYKETGIHDGKKHTLPGYTAEAIEDGSHGTKPPEVVEHRHPSFQETLGKGSLHHTTITLPLNLGNPLAGRPFNDTSRFAVAACVPVWEATSCPELAQSGYFSENGQIKYFNEGNDYAFVIGPQYHFLKVVKEGDGYQMRFCDASGTLLQKSDFSSQYSPAAPANMIHSHQNFLDDGDALNVQPIFATKATISTLNLEEVYNHQASNLYPYSLKFLAEEAEEVDKVTPVVLTYPDGVRSEDHSIFLNHSYAIFEYNRDTKAYVLRLDLPKKDRLDAVSLNLWTETPPDTTILATVRQTALEEMPLYFLFDGKEIFLSGNFGEYELIEERSKVQEILTTLINNGLLPPNNKYAIRLAATDNIYALNGKQLQQLAFVTDSGTVDIPIQKYGVTLALETDAPLKIFSTLPQLLPYLEDATQYPLEELIMRRLIPKQVQLVINNDAEHGPTAHIQVGASVITPELSSDLLPHNHGILASLFANNNPQIQQQLYQFLENPTTTTPTEPPVNSEEEGDCPSSCQEDTEPPQKEPLSPSDKIFSLFPSPRDFIAKVGDARVYTVDIGTDEARVSLPYATYYSYKGVIYSVGAEGSTILFPPGDQFLQVQKAEEAPGKTLYLLRPCDAQGQAVNRSRMLFETKNVIANNTELIWEEIYNSTKDKAAFELRAKFPGEGGVTPVDLLPTPSNPLFKKHGNSSVAHLSTERAELHLSSNEVMFKYHTLNAKDSVMLRIEPTIGPALDTNVRTHVKQASVDRPLNLVLQALDQTAVLLLDNLDSTNSERVPLPDNIAQWFRGILRTQDSSTLSLKVTIEDQAVESKLGLLRVSLSPSQGKFIDIPPLENDQDGLFFNPYFLRLEFHHGNRVEALTSPETTIFNAWEDYIARAVKKTLISSGFDIVSRSTDDRISYYVVGSVIGVEQKLNRASHYVVEQLAKISTPAAAMPEDAHTVIPGHSLTPPPTHAEEHTAGTPAGRLPATVQDPKPAAAMPEDAHTVIPGHYLTPPPTPTEEHTAGRTPAGDFHTVVGGPQHKDQVEDVVFTGTGQQTGGVLPQIWEQFQRSTGEAFPLISIPQQDIDNAPEFFPLWLSVNYGDVRHFYDAVNISYATSEYTYREAMTLYDLVVLGACKNNYQPFQLPGGTMTREGRILIEGHDFGDAGTFADMFLPY